MLYTAVFSYSVLQFLIFIFSYMQRGSSTLYSFADVLLFISRETLKPFHKREIGSPGLPFM